MPDRASDPLGSLYTMAKSQKKSSREIRKPKADKSKPSAPVGLADSSPVNALMRKPKAKL